MFTPELPTRKKVAIDRIGFGAENKVVLRFDHVFWDPSPYIQCTDDRFRLLNGNYFGKPNTIVLHASPPFGNGYWGMNDEQVVAEGVQLLRNMYKDQAVPDPIW